MSDKLNLSISQVKSVLAARLKRQIAEPGIKLRSIFIEGERGIGKTDIIKQVAAEVALELGLEVNTVTLPAAVLEAPDINGLGYVELNITRFAAPEFLPAGGFGILFIDEVNRANTDVQNGLLTLVQDRQIHQHKIGDGWLIVGAGNTNANGGNYKVKEFDPALKDRFAYVMISPTSGDLITYLETKYKDNIIVKYLQDNPQVINFDSKGTTSPRAIEYAIRATIKTPVTNKEEMRQLLSLELGTMVTGDMMEYFETKIQLLTLEDVLTNKRKTAEFLDKNKDAPTVVSNIVSVVSEEIIRRFDKETSGLQEENMKLDAEKVYLFSKMERENVSAFINNLNDEMRVGLYAQTAPQSHWSFNTEMAFSRHFLINLATKKKRCKAHVYTQLHNITAIACPNIKEDLQKVADLNIYAPIEE